MRTKIPYDSRLQSKAEIFLNQGWDKKKQTTKTEKQLQAKTETELNPNDQRGVKW